MSSKRLSQVFLGCALVVGGCGGTSDDGAGGAGTPANPAGSSAPQAGTVASQAGTMASNAGSGGTMTSMSGRGGGSGTTGGGSGTMAPAGGMSGGGSGSGAEGCATTEEKTGMCKENATGIFAIKVVVDVWWKDDVEPPIVDSGRGPITVYLRGEISDVCGDGSNGKGTIKGCGTELPAFRSDVNCEAFQIEIPDEIWDKPTMPSFTTTGMTSGFNPGDVLTLATASGLVGIDLMDENGPWPTPEQTATFACPAGTGAQCFPDDDGDGKPGITIRMGKIGERFGTDTCTIGQQFTFRGAPLDAIRALDPSSVRASVLQIGLRTRLGGAGTINADCASGVGDSVAEKLDSRVLDCQRTDNSPCETADAEFVDNQAPTYNILAKGAKPPMDVVDMKTGQPIDQTPSVGTRSAIVRLGNLGETFDCAAVRGAAFPAL